MEFEFDKEIDAILRKARGVEAVTSTGAHMDADELAAFAENAVPATARMRYVSHLADCKRCRKILSNVVLSNSEAETETASSVVSASATETGVPWYRRFFAFPQLAYTMGGAVLVFSAFFGYLIIRNLPGASNSDVAVSTEKAPAAQSQAPANASAPVSVGNSNSTSTSTTNSSVLSNSSAASNASTTTNSSAPLPTGNSPVIAPQPELQDKLAENEIAVVPQATPPADAKREEKPFSVDGGSRSRDDLAKINPASPTAGAVSENRAKEEDQKKDAAASEDGDASVSDNKQKAMRKQPVPKMVEKTRSNAGETRTVGGKNFDNIGGTWFDQAVGGRKQKTVRRGTSEYLKLDAGLRSIADQLGGTVVILWGGKAYRIE